MDRPYPASLAELDRWRRDHATTLEEARQRYMQFVVVESLASTPGCRDGLSFKGGNALRFFYGNQRSTVDLDYTAAPSFPDSEDRIRDLLNRAFRIGSMRYSVKARCQKVKRNPRGEDKTFPTHHVTVGYQFPEDRHFRNFETYERHFTKVIEVQISINDVVCETRPLNPDPGTNVTVKVCALEDILAEKLRALLQQRVRRRNRRQDLYDVARMVQKHGSAIDRPKVSEFFVRKAAARHIEACKSAFDNDIRARAAVEYEHLFDEHDPEFIPVDEAWAILTTLVGELDIPD